MQRLLLLKHHLLHALPDLFVLVVWSLALTGVWLNTFFSRDCSFFRSGSLTVTCQSSTDLMFVLLIGIGAGLALRSYKLAVLGFVFAHILSTVFFVIIVLMPALLGMTDPLLSDSIMTISIVVAFWSQFPLGVLLSFFGCGFGALLRTIIGL